MKPDEFNEGVEGDLAAVAHRCWCERLQREGWRYGPYDEAARTHDALRPFQALPEEDRRWAIESVRAFQMADALARAIEDYPRGAEREAGGGC